MEQEIGVIKQRIQSIESGHSDLRASLTAINTKIDERFSALSTKFDERSRTPWSNIISACGVTMGVIVAVGALAMNPLRENIVEINADYKYLTRSEVVPRSEHLEKWRSYEKDVENIRHRIVAESTSLQRQVDDLRTQYGNTFNIRDIILQMQNKIDRLEVENGKKG